LADSLALEHDFFDDRDENIEWGKYEYIIPSPGIPPSHKLYQQSIPIVAELDFAARYLPETTKIVAITGTDGKSTTAWITWCLLSRKFTKDRVYLS
jgi:UDP-N-acetylmuramoylalanine--D-glutamate ligase